jgi:hypothetical protein
MKILVRCCKVVEVGELGGSGPRVDRGRGEKNTCLWRSLQRTGGVDVVVTKICCCVDSCGMS